MDEIIDIDDLRKLKLPELKALCKQTGVPSSGAKEVLIKRLAVSMGMDEEDEGVDEDALLEEEEEEEDKEEDAAVSSSDKVCLCYWARGKGGGHTGHFKQTIKHKDLKSFSVTQNPLSHLHTGHFKQTIK